MKLTLTTQGIVNRTELNVVVRELNRIEQRDGALQPETIVDEARPVSSPLHQYFTWNNSEAAELYRRWEARKLIQSVRVIYDGKKDGTIVRAYVSLVNDDERGYYGMARVLSDSDLRAQLLAKALQEAESWRERYEHLEELSEIVSSIKKTKSQIQ